MNQPGGEMNPISASTTGPWTSRRRLLAALAGGVPNRVPTNTYALAGRNSLNWYNNQPSYRGLMDFIPGKLQRLARRHADSPEDEGGGKPPSPP
jgi:hypothetical protein